MKETAMRSRASVVGEASFSVFDAQRSAPFHPHPYLSTHPSPSRTPAPVPSLPIYRSPVGRGLGQGTVGADDVHPRHCEHLIRFSGVLSLVSNNSSTTYRRRVPAKAWSLRWSATSSDAHLLAGSGRLRFRTLAWTRVGAYICLCCATVRVVASWWLLVPASACIRMGKLRPQ
eukprot:1364172-Rhodomonas_salina.4